MFERRLTIFWMILTAIAALIIGRLVQIQVVDAAEYQSLAERLLTRDPQYLSAPRGTIFDRDGTPLLRDEPSYSICIQYDVLADPIAPDGRYMSRVARALRRRGDFPADMPVRDVVHELVAYELPWMWRRLANLAGTTVADLHARAAEIRDRIDRIRRVTGQDRIREQTQRLPLLEQIDNELALATRLELEQFPWIRVIPATSRIAHDVDALPHVLGRMGAASPPRIADDPLRGDELRELRPRDRCGITGVERLGELSLRGTRGRVLEAYDGAEIERIDPIPGRDVYLTIDADLQRDVMKLLEAAVPTSQHPAGASAVVIDVATREIRALASYPAYSYEEYGERYGALRADTRRLPLKFRAVAAQYPPGSICKAISLIGALTDGKITAHTRIHCTGYLLPEKPTIFRCWITNQHPGVTHDITDDPRGQDAESAVKNSCNIYFYKVGGMLGPERLCYWFSRFGLGRTQGTDLIEESPGIVPNSEWLEHAQGRTHRTSDAWNFAIGQGEVTATPLQAANVAATIASGQWQPVHLAFDDAGRALGADPTPPIQFNPDHLRVLRRGMWRVVNDPSGTARRARLDVDGYEFCGKTGSAQTVPRVLDYRYIFEWPDGRRESVVALSKDEALDSFGDEKPEYRGRRANRRYPALEEGEKLPAHAWFIGFTQPTTTPRGAAPTGKVYAISVLIEFGGSGGRIAGPVAKAIAERLLAPPIAE
jgi:penicillin-binding protein 2